MWKESSKQDNPANKLFYTNYMVLPIIILHRIDIWQTISTDIKWKALWTQEFLLFPPLKLH